MNRAMIRLYQHLPPTARNWAATGRGLYLRWWRYGASTERLVSEALERDSWPLDRWKSWQQEQLARLLYHAAVNVPYYREHWAERRRRGDNASWESLSNWPVLTKEALRQNPRAFLADGRSTRFLFHEHTSGTTGKSLDLWRTRNSIQQWYALCEARARRWYGVTGADRWGILGGQLVTAVDRDRPPFWVWNSALKQLYLSSYHLSPKFAAYYLEAIERYGVTYLLGYTSALHALAVAALERGGPVPQLRVAITNAEPVLPYQRETIAAAFRCPVRETYGLAELVSAASECDHGNLHVWPEVGHLEILSGGEPVRGGESGELVCTGLLNPEMPLIRYSTGDRAAWPWQDAVCTCGRPLPLLATIEGRNDDVLYTADGRAIGRLDPVFKASLPIREAQIVQETLCRFRVLYVPAPDFTAAAAHSIKERLRDRVGQVEVICEQVEAIPRGANGKFRAVVSRLSPEERSRVRRAAACK